MKITVITTGGTIAKTFNEFDGSLRNQRPVVEGLIAALRLPDIQVAFRHILHKDSLDMTDEDRQFIVEEVRDAIGDSEAIIVVHGTDTLGLTGELLCCVFEPTLQIPIVLTGAMRPYEFRDSDAVQNVTEAMLACRLAPPGVYVAMHNRVLRFPGVIKDRKTLTFVKDLATKVL